MSIVRGKGRNIERDIGEGYRRGRGWNIERNISNKADGIVV